jgi:hypothetical protein
MLDRARQFYGIPQKLHVKAAKSINEPWKEKPRGSGTVGSSKYPNRLLSGGGELRETENTPSRLDELLPWAYPVATALKHVASRRFVAIRSVNREQ